MIQISVGPFQKKNTDPRQMLLSPKKHLITLNNLFIKSLFKDLPNVTRLNGIILCKSFLDYGFYSVLSAYICRENSHANPPINDQKKESSVH